jgi:hypothetical protein
MNGLVPELLVPAALAMNWGHFAMKLGRFGMTSCLMGAAMALGGCTTRPTATPVEVTTNDPRPTKAATVSRGDCTAKPGGDAPRPLAKHGVGGGVVLADWGDRTVAFVADADGSALVTVDVDGHRQLSSLALEGEPAQLVLTPDGRLLVTITDRAELALVLPTGGAEQPLVVACRAAMPAEPSGIALDPSGRNIAVVSSWAAELRLLDATTLAPAKRLGETDRMDLARSPHSVAFTAGGTQLAVSHSVGGVASLVDLAEGELRVVPLSARHDHELTELSKKIREVRKEDDALDEAGLVALREIVVAFEDELMEEDSRHGGRRRAAHGYAIAVSSDPAGRVFLPQVLVDPGSAQRRTQGYGEDHLVTEVASVAVIDSRLGAAAQSSLRLEHRFTYRNNDNPKARCLLPRAAALDERSGSLLVACHGSDMVLRYDALSPSPSVAETMRWRVPAGPTALAVDPFDRRAVVWSQLDRALTIISLDGSAKAASEVRSIELAPIAGVDAQLALGASLFVATNDARISRDGRGCASCHPGGRDDGLVWSTPDGPRRTPMLVGGVGDTAPFGWDGSDADLEAHLLEATQRLGGIGGLRSLERKALLAFVRQLRGPTSSAAGEGQTRRGADIFASTQAGCSACHSGPTLSDGKIHDVGSGTRVDRGPRFATPSLRFVAGRAPYFHDGRYPTLDDLLKDEERKMGHTGHLDEDDRAALVVYLESL